MADLTTLQTVAAESNYHFWQAQSLLMALILIAEKLDDDEWVPEIQNLLKMTHQKVLDMQGCFNPHIPMKGMVRHG